MIQNTPNKLHQRSDLVQNRGNGVHTQLKTDAARATQLPAGSLVTGSGFTRGPRLTLPPLPWPSLALPFPSPPFPSNVQSPSYSDSSCRAFKHNAFGPMLLILRSGIAVWHQSCSNGQPRRAAINWSLLGASSGSRLAFSTFVNHQRTGTWRGHLMSNQAPISSPMPK